MADESGIFSTRYHCRRHHHNRDTDIAENRVCPVNSAGAGTDRAGERARYQLL